MQKILVKFLFIVLSIIAAYQLGKLSTTINPVFKTDKSQTETNNSAKFLTKDELLNTSGIIYEGITEAESGPYITTLRKFESLHKDNDANSVLAMFYPPVSNGEKDALAFLEGTDFITKTPIIRLFSVNLLSHKLNWFLIKSVKRSGNNVSIELLENRTYYDPTGTPKTNKDLYFSNQEYLILEIGKDLKIEKFHFPKTEDRSIGKYDGFYSQ